MTGDDPLPGSTGRPWAPGPRLTPDISQDAVVVIPGIMGSTLIEADSGVTLWGLAPRILARAWETPGALTALSLTEGERAGRYGRVRPTGLLRVPGFSPVLHGVEPYTDLVIALRQMVADEAAVLEFSYDWRLPVMHNAALLAEATHRHLQRWRAHPAHEDARRLQSDDRPAQLVLVAHSMGGLLARSLGLISGAIDDIRAVVTFGTPFAGSVKAAVMLNSGQGSPVPLPRQQLRKLAVTLPGVYDLLPTYRCVAGPDLASVDDVHRLRPADVAAFGGDRNLAKQSADFHARLAHMPLPGHRPVVGVQQPTWQSLQIRDGVVHPERYMYRRRSDGTLLRDEDGIPAVVDFGGDGTVYEASAVPQSADHSQPIPQQHGELASTREAIACVRQVLLKDGHPEARLGGDALGIDVPDLVTAGRPWQAHLTATRDPAAVRITATELSSGWKTTTRAHYRDTSIVADLVLPTPGLYRITATSLYSTPVSQIVCATATPAE